MPPRVLVFGDTGPLADRMSGQGFEVLRAPGRGRALGLARDLLPELVLIAAGGDPKAASDILEALTTDTVARLLPVVLVLGRSDTAALCQGLEAGASDVISLEMSPEEQIARARSALRAKQLVEERIAEKQRLTLLELAGAVAHKMNQPLTSMSIIVETLLVSQGSADLSSDRLMAKLGEMQRLVDKMAQIVKQVAGVVDYRTVDYVGDVRIIDLEPNQERKRR
jgi:DNA-binding response OmpR family regulator